VVEGSSHNGRQTGLRRRSSSWDLVDRAVGSVASGLGMLVVLASIPSPSTTGLMASAGVLLGAFGYLLGARLLGAVTIIVSAAAILVSLLS
jgi:NADH:ubiquinone oxidoreductase subunit 4 (subunit M)